MATIHAIDNRARAPDGIGQSLTGGVPIPDLPIPDLPIPDLPIPDLIAQARRVIETEADALVQLARDLDHNFADAVRLIITTTRRVVVTGMGKSGHIARKIVATLSATGTPAMFLHPAEAAHGDLGMVMPGDLLMVLSNSGSTPELVPIMRHARLLHCPIVAIAGCAASPVGRGADVTLALPPAPEACPIRIAPTTSTTMMLALGDALAVTAMRQRGLSRAQIMRLHPGGAIGAGLTPVDDLMHRGAAMPLVPLTMPMREVMVVMTEKRLGIAGVVDAAGQLCGVITDGDLRRHIDRLMIAGAASVMTPTPRTIPAGSLAGDARTIMRDARITALFVVACDDPCRPLGVVHIHDLAAVGDPALNDPATSDPAT
ncbi:KpsF/GutQ family sugar-phosphate isomerase [Novosphingobium sp.]|uniref:KpsF/GutQ family sugar-phosphate isomerase n=1 Tax=Novosphingobium sp. TaxID=1874826 RepID=UPI00333E3452